MDVASALSARAPVAAALALAALAAWRAPALHAALSGLVARLPQRWRALGADAPIWRDLALGLLLLAAALVATTASHAGYNIDESFQSQHGRDLFAWYAAKLGGADPGPFRSDIPVMNHYGGFFELPAEALARTLPYDPTFTRHLATGVVAWLGLVAAYGLGATLHSRAAGALALLFLLAMPRYHGHAFANPKDVPFAVCMLFALWATCRALPRVPALSARDVLVCGVAIGAALGVRVGGVLALGIFGLGLLAAWGLRASGGSRDAASFARLCASGLAVVAVAWLVMLAGWPWAQERPLLRPFEAIAYFRDIVGVQQVDFAVFYDGRLYRLSQIPRTYTLVWLLISLPEFFLATGLAAPALRRVRGTLDPKRLGAWLTVALVGVALLSTADPGVIQYDGIRHFLFVLPPLAVLLAIGLVAGLRAGSLRWRVGGGVLVASLLGLTLVDAVRLHPYEYTYFNRTLAGGLPRAALSYETDYLGQSYREAVSWTVANVAPPPARPLRIAICKGWSASLEDALAAADAPPERFHPVAQGTPADLAVAITRGDCPQRFPGRVIHRVERAGTTLAVVVALAR